MIRGAGFGHGVGLSQYGTLGYAQHGWTHDRILAHYYTGTQLGRLSGTQTVRVLLRSGHSRYVLSGAAEANGLKLDPGKRYLVTSGGKGEVIRETAGQVARHRAAADALHAALRRSPDARRAGRQRVERRQLPRRAGVPPRRRRPARRQRAARSSSTSRA